MKPKAKKSLWRPIPTSWRPTQPPMGDIMTTEFKSIYPGIDPSGQKVLNHQ
jgi:hypothetical protein